jgi:hypothetical protein
MAKKKTDTDSTAQTAAPAKRRAPAAKTTTPTGASVSTAELIETAADTAGTPAEDGEYQPTHEEIAEAAYFRHLNRGGQGDEFNDWVEAEQELKRRRREP